MNTSTSPTSDLYGFKTLSDYFKIVRLRNYVLAFILYISSPLSAQYISERPDWAGIWVNTGNSSTIDLQGLQDEIAGEAGRLSWSEVEPTQGNFDFSKLKSALVRANNAGYYHYFVLWTGPHAPNWIYNKVPKVTTTKLGPFPYYLDSNYKLYVTNLVKAMAAYLATLPQYLTNKLAFIQPGFGSTGDRELYKGTPTDPQFNISDTQYFEFMELMTNEFVSAFSSRPETSHIKFLFNIDDYDGNPVIVNPTGEEIYGKWIKENYSCQLRKLQYTIAVGDLNPNEIKQDNDLRDNFYGNLGRWGGNPEFVRGELNEGETAITPYYQLNPVLFYYWTAISGVDRGLDGWEVKYDYLNLKYREAYNFSHRYSFYKRAEKSPYAFVALRDVLDYSDIVRFSETQHGTASKSNQSRINSILSAYSAYGAQNDDMAAAVGRTGIDYLRYTTGYNDCLWNVIARNNQRFITQIATNETSAGYWRVGVTQNQPYGRFCRGFDVAKSKNAMYFDVDDKYFAGNRATGDGNIKIKIIYYAKDAGSWELKYHAKDGTMKTALAVTNNTAQDWVTTEVTLTDALLNNGGEKGSDIILQNTGGTNCRFHLIELERKVIEVLVGTNDHINTPAGQTIKVHPNPTKDLVKIFDLGMDNGFYSLTIKNTFGQVTFHENAWVEDNKIEKEICISSLPTGIYFLTIENGNRPAVMKIIKVN